jgi:hypothetical protein
MDRFRKQCLQVGSIKGWRHMRFYIRGKEELCITVYGQDDGEQHQQQTAPAAAATETDDDHCLELEPEPEPAWGQPDEARYLLAGYEKYGRPYVWLRSGSPSSARLMGQVSLGRCGISSGPF